MREHEGAGARRSEGAGTRGRPRRHQRPPRGLRGARGAAALLRVSPDGDALRGRRGRPGAGGRPRGAGTPPDGPSRRAVLQRQRSARGTVHASTGRGVSPRRGAEPPVYGSSRSRRSPHHAETRMGPHYLSRVGRRQTTPAGTHPSTTARAGVLGFAKAPADEVAAEGITVNVV